jgi:hypothetical protein
MKKMSDFDRTEVLQLLGVQDERSLNDKLVIGLAALGIGAVLGVGVGLLLAPQSGRRLRADLKARLDEALGGAPEKFDDADAQLGIGA